MVGTKGGGAWLVPRSAGVAVLWAMALPAVAATPTGLSLLMQSDAAYDPATAQRLAEAAPHDLLFRVMGPLTPGSMSTSDIVGFVGGLGTWSGRLWFNVDATKSAFDNGYWGTHYPSSDAYKAYVDYLATVNASLTAAGARTFDGIFLECEGSYLQKNGAFLGHQGLVGSYLDSKSLSTALIGTTGSYKQASSFADLDIDLLPIQAYNFDQGDPPGFNAPSTATAQSLATAIAGELATNYVADPGSLTTPGVVVMFSYEPQFFGATAGDGTAWTAPLFQDFLGDFTTALSGAGVGGGVALGVYDTGSAINAWDHGLTLPEPGAAALLMAAVGAAAVGSRSGQGRKPGCRSMPAERGPGGGLTAEEAGELRGRDAEPGRRRR